jgi:hypothetical protein
MRKVEKKSAKEIIDPDVLEKKLNINRLEQGDAITGYLCNIKPHKSTDEQNSETSCLILYFLDEQGAHYKALFNYEPYLYLIVKPDII